MLLPSLAQQAMDRRLLLSLSFHPVFGVKRPATAIAWPAPACACTPKHAMAVRLCRDPDYQFIQAQGVRSLEMRDPSPFLPGFQSSLKSHFSLCIFLSDFGARESGTKVSMIPRTTFLLEKTHKVFCTLKKNLNCGQIPSFSLIYHSAFQ